MKILTTVAAAALLTIQAWAGPGFDQLFEKYAANDDVTSVNLSESMLRIAAGFIGSSDEEAQALLQSIDKIQLLMTEGSTRKSMADEAYQMIDAEGYEELIRVNEGDEKVRILVKEKSDIINDIVVYVDSSDEFVFINITGEIDPEKVGKALESLDIKIDGINVD